MAENEYLEKATGQSFTIDLVTVQENDGKYWKTKGSVRFGVTIDGENWVYREDTVKMHENSVDDSIASVMLHFSNIINSPNVLEEIEEELKAVTDGETK